MAICDDIAELLSIEDDLQGALERVRALKERLARPASQGEHPASAGYGTGTSDATPPRVEPVTAEQPLSQPAAAPTHDENANAAHGQQHRPTASTAPGRPIPSEGGQSMAEVKPVPPPGAAAPTTGAGSGGAPEFEVLIDRRPTMMTEEEVLALDPESFDVFLDVIHNKVGGRGLGGNGAVSPREAKLQPKDLYVLRRLLECQGRVLCASNLPEAGDGDSTWRAVTRRVHRLRKALHDNARKPRLILPGSNDEDVQREGRGVVIPLEVHCCLVTRPVRGKRLTLDDL